MVDDVCIPRTTIWGKWSWGDTNKPPNATLPVRTTVCVSHIPDLFVYSLLYSPHSSYPAPSCPSLTQHRAQREEGFNSRFGVKIDLAQYNALYDPNMRHFFENSIVQSHLYKTGQIDKAGRVIDLDKNASKLHIIEKEFLHAEKTESDRQKDEAEMRRRVQLKRGQALEKARKEEKLIRMKADRRIRQEIVMATREAQGLLMPSPAIKGGKKKKKPAVAAGAAADAEA